MPNRDGTGPNGKGPKTGRGKGNCTITHEELKKRLNITDKDIAEVIDDVEIE